MSSDQHTDCLLHSVTLPTVLGLSLLFGCSGEVTTPSPELDTEREGGATSPGYRCTTQGASWVELRGKNFTPLVVGALEADGPEIAWPWVRLTRVRDLNGESVDGAQVEIRSTGSLVEGGANRTEQMALHDGGANPHEAGVADAGDAGEPEGDTPETSDRRLIWLSDTTIRFKVTPEMDLEPGTYDVTVVSGRRAGGDSETNEATAEAGFGMLPPPSVEEVAEMEPVCLRGRARTVQISGEHFMRQGDRMATVEIGEQQLQPDSMNGCEQPGGPFGDLQLCTEMTVELPADATGPAGSKPVDVQNFAPAECGSLPAEEEGDRSSIRVVDRPKIYGASPNPVCSEQRDYTIEVTGERFLGIGDAKPTVSFGDTTAEEVELADCTLVAGNVRDVRNCSTLRADVPAGSFSTDGMGRSEVAVTNPGEADCAATETTRLTAVAPPEIGAVEPQPIVASSAETSGSEGDTGNRVVVEGERFAQIDGARPKVTVSRGTETTRRYDAAALGGCRELEGPGAMRVNLCSRLEFEIPEGEFEVPADQDAASLEVGVANPDPLGCSTGDGAKGQLQVVDPPELNDVSTTPICTATRQTSVVVDGEGFVFYDGTGPTVGVGMEAYRATKGPDANCSAVGSEGRAAVEECDQLEFTAPRGELRASELAVTVYNPDPVGGYSVESGDAQVLTVLEAPNVAFVEPELTCLESGARTLIFRGQRFLRVVPANADPPRLPQVTFAQTSVNVTDRSVPNPSQHCTEISVPGRPETYQWCDRLEVTIEAAGQTGVAEARIRNPAPADCRSRGVQVTIDSEPSVSSVAVRPQSSCSADGYRRVVVSGDRFLEADGTLPEVTFDGSTTYEARAANNCSAVPNTPRSNLQYCDEIVVYGETSVVQGTTDVSVENPSPSGCASSPGSFDVTANCP